MKSLLAFFVVGITGPALAQSVVNEATLPSCLRITAKDDHGMVMAMEHTEYNVTGVQFHPESVLTEFGKEMITNWINS